jgi:DNA-binding winged helix-turn-helix (wHTH) protein
VTFGDYRLDLRTRQLFHGTAEVRVSPKAFDLLQHLIENRTRAVSKQELYDRLWPGTFVTEANLPSLVAELRRALDDRPPVTRFIRTVHGFGYAFGGQVTDDLESGPVRHICWIICKGRETPMRAGENIIGRDESATLTLDFPSVSRRHARIVVSGDGATVEDLGSKNGTFLHEARLTTAVPLNDHDELQIGSVKMTVRILHGGAPTQTT